MKRLPPISVIIPIYKDVDLTRRCILSCLPSIICESGRLILVNDDSPETGMQRALEEIAAQHPQTVTLLVNHSNQGFTASVNRGLEMSSGHDVVLLNSDVIVPKNWLQALRKDAQSNLHIGTLTPLSNNSTITCLPEHNTPSKQYLQYDVNLINEAFGEELELVLAPTGIGFCMLITAECLRRVGHLDVGNFGKGYGEENDFCQRALKFGFLNALTPNLYCHHIGSVSFGESSNARMEVAFKKLAKLHPNYHLDVASWIARDPLGPARILRKLQVSKQVGIPIILHITHGLGGGTTKYVHSLVAATSEQLFHIILSGRRNQKDPISITFGWPKQGAFEELSLQDDNDLLPLLKSVGIDCIHIHHLVGVPLSIVDWLQGAEAPPYMITFHDYYLINGNPVLTDSEGEFAGINASPYDSPLVNMHPHPFEYDNWRRESGRLIDRSICNIFPSKDSYSHYAEAFGSVKNTRIVPHDNATHDKVKSIYMGNQHSQRGHRVVALGALSLEKGADFLERVAQESARMLPRNSLEFKIIGFAYRKLNAVEDYGPYRDEELQDLIKAKKADCIFFPARWPETYSYTLSEAIQSGLPIVAPKLGSFQERLTDYPCHFLYDTNINAGQLAISIHNFLREVKGVVGRSDGLRINNFYESAYIFMSRSLRNNAWKADPKIVIEIAARSLPAYQKAKRGRERALNLAIRIYKHPMSTLFVRLVPFRMIRRLKEWIYPWPIRLSKEDL